MSESPFDERMLFDPLDGTPDSAFENALLVRLQDELTAPTSHPSTEPDPGTSPDPDVEIVMLKPNDVKDRRRPWLALVAAAIVLIAGLAVLWPRDEAPVVTDRPEDGEPEPTPDDGGETSAEATTDIDIAEAFMAGRIAHDAAAVQAAVADDAMIVYAHEWIDDPADYADLVEWERIAGVTFSDVDCAPGSPGRVRCSYSMTTAMSEALGFEPYANHFLFDLDGGLITGITHRRAELAGIIPQDDYRIAVYFNNFAPWVDNTHPEDWEVMTAPPRPGNDTREFVFTEDALALWEIRIAEFIASLQDG